MGIPLQLRAHIDGEPGRKKRVICEVYAGDVLTAIGNSVLVRVDTSQLATQAHAKPA